MTFTPTYCAEAGSRWLKLSAAYPKGFGFAIAGLLLGRSSKTSVVGLPKASKKIERAPRLERWPRINFENTPEPIEWWEDSDDPCDALDDFAKGPTNCGWRRL